MCFRNSINAKAAQLAKRYGKKTDLIEAYREITEQNQVAAFTHPKFPIITCQSEIQVQEWGLIPFWVKPKRNKNPQTALEEAIEQAEQIRKVTFNARSETIFEKPSFREAIRSKRCIIPSTGYYEYHHNKDKTTTLYFIFVKSEEIFSIGGIYDEWENPQTKEIISGFSMITTPANPLTAYIHNGGKNPHRMPLILKREEEEEWLNTDLQEEEISQFMQPYPQEDMDSCPVSKDLIYNK